MLKLKNSKKNFMARNSDYNKSNRNQAFNGIQVAGYEITYKTGLYIE